MSSQPNDNNQDDELCGEITTDGTPCENTADSCPWHNTDNPPENGRDTKLTKQRQEGIASMIEEGHSIGAAVRSHGITVQSFYNWMERGSQQEEGIYADFFERITRARGHGEKQYLDAIVSIAKENNDTQTLLSLLKSRYPDAWADAETGRGDEGVNVYLEADETIEVD